MELMSIQERKNLEERFNELADKFIDWLETVPREIRDKEPTETLVLVFFSEVVYKGEVSA